MPQQDSDKQSDTLLSEAKAGVPGNLTAVHSKLDELISRVIKNGDADDIISGGVQQTRGGIRPQHAPLIP